MPVINFTTADVLRGKTLAEGWYSWEIKSLIGPKASKDGGSLNYEFIASLIDNTPELNGKEVVVRYNSKLMSMMIPLVAASRGVPLISIEPKDFAVDTDEIIGKKVDGKAVTSTYEGNIKNEISEFVPYKSIVGKPPVF